MMTVTLFTLVLSVLFAQRREAEERLAKERAMLARLHEVGARLWLKRDLRQALDEILAGAIELLGADMGAIRIWDSARSMIRIEAHRGFTCEYLDLFRKITAETNSLCGQALRSGERMVIEDVEEDTRFAPFRPLARAAGYRALQSTPILSREGEPLGVLGTHFRSVHRPADQDLHLLDLYVRLAAEIIERHKAEDALRESEERLRLAQLKTGIGLWDWDLRTGKITRTPELAAIFGIEHRSESCYADFRDLVHSEDIAAFEVERDTAVRRREMFNLECRIIRPDGQMRRLLSLGGAVYDAATGEPTRILGNMTDITERKIAELALAERNTQLELASKTARVGTFVIEFHTGLVKLSPGCASIFGLPESTTEISREYGLKQLVHPEDLSDLQLRRDEAFLRQQRELVAQYRIRRVNDGEVRWMEVRGLNLYDRDGQPSSAIAVIIDFTERKRAELALAERNAQLALLGQAVLIGSYAHESDLETMRVSEGYCAIHGLPVGTTETTRTEFERTKGFRARIFSDKREVYTQEFRIVRAGEVRWIESRGVISYDSDGRPQRIIGISIDVTERQQLEHHKNTLISELDHRVKNVLAIVSTVVSRTQETSGSMAEFVAALDGRIKSMAATHELLSHRRWQGIPLAKLVGHELAPYTTSSNASIEGPDVVLSAEASQTLAMVFHELATNAAKFGALSVGSGRLAVRWNVWNVAQNGGSQSWLCIRWEESGGPNVVPPARSGFGTSIVRELIPYELGGSAEPEYLSAGFRCKLEIPAHWLTK
jgi:PAS domain S-box-containing protein